MAILAIDFGGTRTRAAWFDADMTLIARDEMLSQVSDGPEITIGRMIALAKRLVPNGTQPALIGISGPGPMDAERGVIHHAETLPGWRAIPLAAQIGAAFGGAAVHMQNDGNLAAVAEYHLGAGQGADPMIYLTISTGIGGGAMLDGRLFTGWRGLAAEPGHMRFVHPSDGHAYRLEDLASGTALGRWAQRRLADESAASSLRSAAVVDGRAVGQAAQSGDAFALSVVTEAGRWLGYGLVNLLHLFNPRAVVLGGSVTRLGDLLLDPAREVMAAELMSADFDAPDLLRMAGLGDDVCLFGAAYYARSRDL